MDRIQILRNSLHRVISISGLVESISNRLSCVSLKEVQEDLTLTEEEVDSLRQKEWSIRLHDIYEDFAGLSLEDLVALDVNDDGELVKSVTTPLTSQQKTASQPKTAQSVCSVQTATERVAKAKYIEQFEEHVQEHQRQFAISVMSELLNEAPVDVVHHINMFLRHGVTEEACNTLLRLYARTIPNALSTVSSYTLDRRIPDTQIHHFASINSLLTIFDKTMVHFTQPKDGNFSERISVIFPAPAPELEETLHELANPRTGVPKKEARVFAHLVYVFVLVNLMHEDQQQAVLFHEMMMRQACSFFRVIPLIYKDWKWRIAKKGQDRDVGKLHFCLNPHCQ